ncbi:PP2C family protein-serine/threonine phosphatase [Streptomyces sp. MI02-2A]|uniref:PP2C family protein-serine/threonine phosphatase n=1 Tax=unclassified Streptomyces TaxID=2593676 RepID=UPI0029B72C5A|nr:MULTISPECIES: PP2C family protein-serine/threonine phosphatase [unclassified Streptomyces]MDX3265933.1 PP2C family protein-serine/threonine phosphatase [Streptomyces sp. MI02-2A]
MLALASIATCAMQMGLPPGGGVPWSDYSIFAPLIASALLPVRRTRFAAGVIMALTAVVIVVDQADGLLHSPLLLIHLGTLVVVALLILGARERHDRHLRVLHQVWAVSEAAQRVLLRPLSGQLGPLNVASVYRAATAYAMVGGDLYAAARTGRTTRFLIGDVRGKGLSAIEDASALLGAFREAAHQHHALPELAAALENSVRRHLAQVADSDPDGWERFVTAVLVEIPDDELVIQAVNWGHPAPLLRHGDRITRLLPSQPTPPLGLAGARPDDYHVDTYPFGSGDTLLLYTDGLIEARNTTGCFFPILDRAATWTWRCPNGLLQHVSQDLDTHTGKHLGDDLAMVAIQHTFRPTGDLSTAGIMTSTEGAAQGPGDRVDGHGCGDGRQRGCQAPVQNATKAVRQAFVAPDIEDGRASTRTGEAS